MGILYIKLKRKGGLLDSLRLLGLALKKIGSVCLVKMKIG
jgi:hypothetical protein